MTFFDKLRIFISSYPLFSFFLTPDKRFPEALFWRFSTNFGYLFTPIPYFHFVDPRSTYSWGSFLTFFDKLRILISSNPLFSFIRFSTNFAYLFPPISYFHFFWTPDKRFPESLLWRFLTNLAYFISSYPLFSFF